MYLFIYFSANTITFSYAGNEENFVVFCRILICQSARLTRVNIYIVRMIYDADTIEKLYIFGAKLISNVDTVLFY